jgi:hypothetical protein
MRLIALLALLVAFVAGGLAADWGDSPTTEGPIPLTVTDSNGVVQTGVWATETLRTK